MHPSTDTKLDQSPGAEATALTPEVQLAAIESILSKGKVEVSEVLQSQRAATLALVSRLLEAAGIEATFSTKDAQEPNVVNIALAAEAEAATGELSPEQLWFDTFKVRFYALRHLHQYILWTDVEKSLKADHESATKLMALDAKGHAMNVFGEEKGELIFASGWDEYSEVSPDHRNIVFDAEAQEWLAKNHPNQTCNGNATDIVKAMGAELAETALHEQLSKVVNLNGWAWLKTDAATTKTGRASCGDRGGVYEGVEYDRDDAGSFRAALRVKKA